MCAQGGWFPQLLRESPAGRAGLASRPQPVTNIAHPVPPGAGKQPPSPRTGCGRASPSPMAAGDTAAGAHPGGLAKESSFVPSPAPRRSPPRGFRGRDAEERGRQRGVNPAEESCCRCHCFARSPPRTLHNGSARQARAGRRAPLRWGRAAGGTAAQGASSLRQLRQRARPLPLRLR